MDKAQSNASSRGAGQAIKMFNGFLHGGYNLPVECGRSPWLSRRDERGRKRFF